MKKISKIVYQLLPLHIKQQYELNLYTGKYELQSSLIIFSKDWEKLCSGEELKYCEVLTVYDFKKYLIKDCNCTIQISGYAGKYNFKTFKSKLINNINRLYYLCKIKNYD